MPPYQEGGFWNTLTGPVVSYVGNLAANVGHETACRPAQQFYKSHCWEEEEEEEEEPPRKKNRKRHNEEEEEEDTSTMVELSIIKKEVWSYLSPE